jgi:hypothetical protein
MNESHDFEINPYASPRAPVAAGSDWVRLGGRTLRNVAKGISLVYYGIVLALLAIIVLAMTMVLAAALDGTAIMVIGGITAVGLAVLANILNLIGPMICLDAPPEIRSKGLIAGSVVFQLLNLALRIFIQIAIRLKEIPREKVLAAQFGSNVVGAIAFILFVLFIKRLAQFIGRSDLSKRASSVLNFWVILTILMFTGGILLSLGTLGALLVLVPALVVGIVVLLMYVRLIDGMRKALVKSVRKAT